MKTYQWRVVAGVLLLCLWGCENSKETKWTYMPDMAWGPTVKPDRDFLDPPPDSVAIDAIIYPKTDEEAEKYLFSPFPLSGPGSKEHRAHGKFLFETHCVVCHGLDGKGDGHIQDKFPKASDIAEGDYVQRADGFFFQRITFGIRNMPSYGWAMSPKERWQIVAHVRELQENALKRKSGDSKPDSGEPDSGKPDSGKPESGKKDSKGGGA